MENTDPTVLDLDLDAINQALSEQKALASATDDQTTAVSNTVRFVTGENVAGDIVAVKLDDPTIQGLTRKTDKSAILPNQFSANGKTYYIKSTGSINNPDNLTAGNLFAKEAERARKPKWLN